MKNRKVKTKPKKSKQAVNLLKYDPTQTGALRRAMERHLKGQFAKLKSAIHKYLKDDHLGLNDRVNNRLVEVANLTVNPAVSEAQRRFLNSQFGHNWVKEHHFDNKGKLPEYKENADVDNASFFSECDRDEKGHCVAKGEHINISTPETGTTEARIKEMFGDKFTHEDIARIAGALPGAEVQMYRMGKDKIEVIIDHPDYESVRTILKDRIINDEFYLKEHVSQGKGLGTEIFANQVEQASKRGFTSIQTRAVRDGEMNGYYTWARLGYDANLKDIIPYLRGTPIPIGVDKLSDLMKTKEGRDFWRKHGKTTDMSFDLREGSLSRRILDDYREERAERKKAGGVTNAFCPTGEGGGIDPTCSPKPKQIISKCSQSEKDHPVAKGEHIKIEAGKDIETLESHIKRFFNGKFTVEDIARVAGALPGAEVIMSPRSNGVEVKINHPDYVATRLIMKDRIFNDEIKVTSGGGKGTGTEIFANQVEQAAKRGFSTIDCFACSKPGVYNGHITWPKLGYDGDIPAYTGIKTPRNKISDLMQTKEGRDFWEKLGISADMSFDLKEGSYSRRTLNEYRQEKAARSRGTATTNQGRRRNTRQNLGQDWQGEQRQTTNSNRGSQKKVEFIESIERNLKPPSWNPSWMFCEDGIGGPSYWLDPETNQQYSIKLSEEALTTNEVDGLDVWDHDYVNIHMGSSYNNKTNPLSIGIIGGGPGGLMAAYMLRQRVPNCHVTIYEASDRLGGKIRSEAFPQEPGAVTERGVAELYKVPKGKDLKGNPRVDSLYDLIKELGLETFPIQGESVVMGDNLIRDEESLEEVYGPEAQQSLKDIYHLAWDSISPEEYHDKKWTVPSDHPMIGRTYADVLKPLNDDTRRFVEAYTHSDVAVDSQRTTAMYGFQNLLTNDSDYLTLYSILGGIEEFPKALTRVLQSDPMVKIKIRCKVEEVHIEQDGYTIHYVDLNESTFTDVSKVYDNVICCLPAGWILSVDWGDLELKVKEYLKPYDNLGNYLKVTILFNRPFWKNQPTFNVNVGDIVTYEGEDHKVLSPTNKSGKTLLQRVSDKKLVQGVHESKLEKTGTCQVGQTAKATGCTPKEESNKSDHDWSKGVSAVHSSSHKIYKFVDSPVKEEVEGKSGFQQLRGQGTYFAHPEFSDKEKYGDINTHVMLTPGKMASYKDDILGKVPGLPSLHKFHPMVVSPRQAEMVTDYAKSKGFGGIHVDIHPDPTNHEYVIFNPKDIKVVGHSKRNESTGFTRNELVNKQGIEGHWWMSDAFGGCCVYDESSRIPGCFVGILDWLIAGDAAQMMANYDKERLKEECINSLPTWLQQDARVLYQDVAVNRFIGEVSGLPGSAEPIPGVNIWADRENHPSLMFVGDYQFDGTLNGVWESADDAVKAIEKELTANANPNHDEHGRFTSGPSSGASSGPSSESSSKVKAVANVINKWRKAVGGSIVKFLDKLPYGSKVRELTGKLVGKMIDRYGKKTTAIIVGAANIISWGAFTLGPMVGHPNYIPASGLLVAGAALAESALQTHRGVKKIKKAITGNEEELSEQEIQEQARNLLSELMAGIRVMSPTSNFSQLIENWCNQHGGTTCKGHMGFTSGLITKAKNMYHSFVSRYGTEGAAAMVAAIAVIPGGLAIVPPIAEAIRYVDKKITGNAKLDYDTMTQDVLDWADHLGLKFDSDIIRPKVKAELMKKLGPTSNFSFTSDPQKLRQFQGWLKQQFDIHLTGMSEEALWEKYTLDGMAKGAGRAFDKMKGKTDLAGMTQEQFLKGAFVQPVAKEKLQLLAARTFEDLKNVTADMGTRMGRTLVDGMNQGLHPSKVASLMDNDLGVGANKAYLISRTELIRAHAEGTLMGLKQQGADKVGVEVEFNVTGGEDGMDFDVCEDCMDLQGQVFPIDEASGLIPQHPNCRCAFLPYVPDEPIKNRLLTNRFAGLVSKSKAQQQGGLQLVTTLNQRIFERLDFYKSINNLAVNSNPYHGEHGHFAAKAEMQAKVDAIQRASFQQGPKAFDAEEAKLRATSVDKETLAKVTAGVETALAKHTDAFAPRLTVEKLYESVGKPAGQSIAEFQATLLKATDAGKIHMGAYTQSPNTLHEIGGDRAFLIPSRGEFKFFVSKG